MTAPRHGKRNVWRKQALRQAVCRSGLNEAAANETNALSGAHRRMAYGEMVSLSLLSVSTSQNAFCWNNADHWNNGVNVWTFQNTNAEQQAGLHSYYQNYERANGYQYISGV